MSWIPINDIDYDFCFNALDVDSGYLIQIDRECGRYIIVFYFYYLLLLYNW